MAKKIATAETEDAISSKNPYKIDDVLLIFRVLHMIPADRWITINQISNLLEEEGHPVHLRKIQRVMKVIRENPELFPIKANIEHRPHGFMWDTSKHGIHLPILGPRESLLLRLADEHLHYLLPASMLASLKPLFRDAKMFLTKNEYRRTASWLRKIKVVSPALSFMPPQVDPNVFENVSDALLHDKYLSVCYRNARNTLVTATIRPLGLVQQDVRTYLVCQFEKYNNYRHLALHRIESAQIVHETFERPETFDLEAYVNAAPFNYARGCTIKLEIITDDPIFVKNLTETPLNPTQHIDSLEGNKWGLTVTIEDSLLLDGWLAMRRSSILSTKKTVLTLENRPPERATTPLEAQIADAQIKSEEPSTTLSPQTDLPGGAHEGLLVINRRLIAINEFDKTP